MINRRQFLVWTGGSVSAAILAACDSRGPKSAEPLLRFAERKNEGVERELFRHTSMDVAGKHVLDARGQFPAYYVSDTVPVWDEAAAGPWMLEVSGMVAAPRRFSLSELQSLPSVTQRVNHYCVEGWTAVASWTGVRLRDIVTLVRPAPEAKYVDFQSFDDDYHESWDIESATHPQTLIAYGFEGASARARPWRACPRVLANQARIQEHKVPHQDRIPPDSQRRVLERPGVRVVRRSVTA